MGLDQHDAHGEDIGAVVYLASPALLPGRVEGSHDDALHAEGARGPASPALNLTRLTSHALPRREQGNLRLTSRLVNASLSPAAIGRSALRVPDRDQTPGFLGRLARASGRFKRWSRSAKRTSSPSRSGKGMQPTHGRRWLRPL
jgi:hypothetical protein